MKARCVVTIGRGFCHGALLLLSSWLFAQVSQDRFINLDMTSGLSQSSVYSIHQDRGGFIWIGTQDGLNRYDGYRFKVFNHDQTNPNTISHDWVQALAKGPEQRLWVGTFGGGLDLYDPATNRFQHIANSPNHPIGTRIFALATDPSGILWIGSEKGLHRLDPNTLVTTPVFLNWDTSEEPDQVRTILIDGEKVWIGTAQRGVCLLDQAGKLLRWVRKDTAPSLSEDRVRGLAKGPGGTLWIATESGLNCFDPVALTNRQYLSQPENPGSLRSNTIRAVFCDRSSRVWVATNDGLSRWVPETDSFLHYIQDSTQTQSLQSNDLLSLYEDDSGVLWVGSHGGLGKWNPSYNIFSSHRPLHTQVVTAFAEPLDKSGLWVGTYGGGLSFMDRQTGSFRSYRKEDGLGLNENLIGSLYVDRRGTLWVGGFKNGLYRFDAAANRFTGYTKQDNQPKGISSNGVTCFLEDTKGQFWVGTKDGGLNLLDRDTDQFTVYRQTANKANSLSSNHITAMALDPEGQLWLGTKLGLNRQLPNQGQFRVFRNDPVNPESLSNDLVLALAFDERGTLWAGTMGGGLNAWNAADYRANRLAIKRITQREGMPSNTINGIIPCKKGQLWISTNKGLVLMDTLNNSFKRFNRVHGLLTDEFNAGSYFADSEGRLYFGGLNGFNGVHPDDVKVNTREPQVSLIDFLLTNQSVPLRDEWAQSPLERTVAFTPKVRLSYLDKVFAIEFAGLHFVDPTQHRYAYRLQGLSDEWIKTDATNRIATYTTLKPGTYQFQVIAANSDGVWNEKGASLEIQILPPTWRSPLAYTIYLLVLLGGVLGYVHLQSKRFAEKQAVIEQLQQLDRLKDSFLANTSHELRTPLNGIIGMAESLAEGAAGPLNERQLQHLRMLVSNGRRLSSLVDDILDFSKMHATQLDLVLGPQNLYALVDGVLAITRPMLVTKNVGLFNLVPVSLPAVHADANRLVQILHNLIGNAVKFTSSGRIEVGALEIGDSVQVWVADTGIGIDKIHHQQIFESFRQIESANERNYGGTGLGLAITRQLVEALGGQIWVESALGEGSTFRFTLPRSEEPAPPLEIQGTTQLGGLIVPDTDAPTEPQLETSQARFTILIVDDEPVNRQVLVSHLSPIGYAVIEAENGPEALDRIERTKVDLVLLDVMMPMMSGFDVCRTLRVKYPMHVLPIIFLTARNQVSDLTTGFAVGGNDYFTKPVLRQGLICRVRTHLDLLDMHRSLEGRILERTRELKEQNEQMRMLDRIVKTVNREMTLPRVLQVLLEQCLSLFGQADKAAFLALDRSNQTYVLAAAVGHDPSQRYQAFTLQELLLRYTSTAEEVDRGVFLNRNVVAIPGRDLPKPQCLLAMAVTFEEEIVGMMVFSNFSDRQAFDHSDLRILARIREHAISALAKARYLEELQSKNEEILRTQNQLILREKMVSLGTLTAGIAHEIKNPLNFINNFGLINKDLAEEGLSILHAFERNQAEDCRHHIQEILESLAQNALLIDKHGKKAFEIVQSIMMLSRENAGDRSVYPVNELVEEYTYLAYSGMQAREKQIDFPVTLDLDEAVGNCELVVQSMGRVILSLVNNAIEALLVRIHQDATFAPILQIQTKRNQQDLEIRIRDNGEGVPPENRSKIFTPFFTTRSPEHNIGLGLFISYDIVVQEHRGSLTLVDTTDGFTEFQIRIPLEHPFEIPE